MTRKQLAAWVAALKSKDYVQCTDYLKLKTPSIEGNRKYEYGHCCLGVLCEVLGVPQKEEVHKGSDIIAFRNVVDPKKHKKTGINGSQTLAASIWKKHLYGPTGDKKWSVDIKRKNASEKTKKLAFQDKENDAHYNYESLAGMNDDNVSFAEIANELENNPERYVRLED